MQVKVGVLAVQGSFIEHMQMLKKCGANVIEVLKAEDLEGVQGLIIPGGESTTIRKLINWNNLREKILENVRNGMKVFGTCAGAVLLARKIIGEDLEKEKENETLNLIDISVKRNAYGRQLQSFEAELWVKRIGKFQGVFIRAPVFSTIGKGIDVLAEYKGMPVLLENENCLVASFHPELTNDTRIHKYFLEKVNKT